MEDIPELRLLLIPLIFFLTSTESLMQHQAIERPGTEIVYSIGMVAIELGKLFGKDLDWKIFEL